jgi:hypothetical protein
MNPSTMLELERPSWLRKTAANIIIANEARVADLLV